MAIHRGIQSAIFYYLSCAPCAEARYRKKRKQEAARTRAERELLQEEHPNLYRHPSPSSTNPHWQTEIALGPALSSRGKRKTNTGDSQRALKAGRVSSNASGEPSMVDLAPSSTNGDRNGSLRNFRSYQREDEELWGSTSNLDGSIHGNSLPRPERARTKDSHTSDYRTYRNPPINDMHPATFTKVHSREDVMWMMQPPPVAEVMSGKLRPPRSRSDSGGSCLSPSSSTMSRQVSNRPHMATPMSRESSSRTSNGPHGQRSPTTSERDFAISPILTPQKEIQLRPSPVLNLNESEDSTSTVIRRPSLAPEPLRRPLTNRVASRPQLSTIASDSSIPAQNAPNHAIDRPKENGAPVTTHSSDESSLYLDPYARRSAIFYDEDRLKLWNEVGPKGVRGKIFRATTDNTPHRHRHDDSEDAMVTIRPELFDSWYTPDFELPKWIHEHTKREVRERWSMDF
ncbi:hypothetical protein PRZ48_001422 [Zasmidium cellare]|uniref:Uncharacterized protein n=1 Tax=Zasmidium cellare TaxID=395010 RepID=A0ABR0F170_ZASCE|nr:hypothetical protein PRZ48_001422 [Zasmidium cellare]